MPHIITNEGAYRLQVGGGTGINWDTAATLKARLLPSSATPDQDDTTMTGKTAITGTTDQALNASNSSITKNTTDNRIEFKYNTSITFSAVPAGETYGWLAIYQEDGGADGTRVPIVYLDVANTATAGVDEVFSFSSNGDVVFYLQQ